MTQSGEYKCIAIILLLTHSVNYKPIIPVLSIDTFSDNFLKMISKIIIKIAQINNEHKPNSTLAK